MKISGTVAVDYSPEGLGRAYGGFLFCSIVYMTERHLLQTTEPYILRGLVFGDEDGTPNAWYNTNRNNNDWYNCLQPIPPKTVERMKHKAHNPWHAWR